MTINKKKQRNRLYLIVTMLVIFLSLVLGESMLLQSTEVTDIPTFQISLESGFYSENQLLIVTAPNGAEIFYTNDGAIPDKEKGILYTDPIEIPAEEEESVQIFRFKTYYKDGSESDVITKTFFMGENIEERYTTNVLHITGDPEELYGYEEGIFVNGKLYDEYMQANPNTEYGPDIDANFFLRGDEYERAVHIDLFSAKGETIFSLNGGVRIHGALTRLKNQKSFRIYARKEYDEQNEFNYPILDSFLSATDATVAKKHKRLVVRNSGNDNGYAFLRSELITALAYEAGYQDVTHAEPVCVYINGVYQGFYWLENTFDAQYFVNRYGEYTGEFVVLEGTDIVKTDEEDPAVQAYVEEYNAFYEKFSAMDLTIEHNYKELCEILDVENYLQYFAIQNYICNLDWPDNNVKVYRYVAQDDNYGESVFDGKYRHLLYDLDYGFGILDYIGYGANTKFLPTVMELSPLFSALMERADCRDYFVNYTCDLMNSVMSPGHVSQILFEMRAEREAELIYMLEESTILEDSWGWEPDISTQYDIVEKSYETIMRFVNNRAQPVLSDMISQLGMSGEDAYTLHLQKKCLSAVQLNSILVEENELTGVYFGSIPVVLEPVLSPNEQFDYWIVNGEIRKEKQLELTTKDMIEYRIEVELAVITVEEPVLQINEVKAKGNSDYIEVINLSEKEVSTRGYYLSDNEELYKYALPDMTMQPGETRRFYGKDCMDLNSLGEFQLNFNIKQQETVTLTYGKQVIEVLVIPKLSEIGVYRRGDTGEKFKEIIVLP